MGVTRREITTYKCNRCGFESEDEYARGGSTHFKGVRSAKAWNGDTGGTEVQIWLCGTCSIEFDAFLRGKAVASLEVSK